MFGFVKKAVKAVSNAPKVLKKIPVVGAPAAAVTSLTLAPVKVANGVISGQRLDKIALGQLKDGVSAATTLAPYAQTVLSFVPGVGTSAAGIIGTAAALAKGKPITEAVVAGMRGALPGGPVAQAAFDVAYAGVQGRPIDEVALNAIPVPPEQRRLIAAAVKATRDIANGKRVDQAIVKRALDAAPPDVRKAIQVGMAVSQGKNLQQAAAMAVKGAVPLPALVVDNMADVNTAKQVADSVVKGLNRKVRTPKDKAVKAKAHTILKTTNAAALRHKDPKVRQAAANGLTLMKRRAAQLKARKRWAIDKHGFARKVG